ncbi:MAG: GGDEF domain-containing protein, partial [Actinomycetota bacterium]|nr:GGDEF domain-containing protein [Actinomycetota bacterium]
MRERASEIVVRWRQRMVRDAPLSADERELGSVVLAVGVAADRPHDIDAICHSAAESLMAQGSDLPQVLRHLGLLRSTLSDLLAEEDADPALRPRIDAAIDALAEAAAAITTQRLDEVAFADPLTRLPNRRAFERDLPREIARAKRRSVGLTAVVGDLDGLKQINDSQGHPAGDRALQALAEGLRGALRGEDCAYRIGGDEFVVLLPGASCADAGAIMARAKRGGAPAFSWGAAAFPGDGADGAALVEVADGRLLESRAQPRRPQASSPARDSLDRRRAPRGRQVALLATVMIGGAALGGGGVAAADGTLPPPVQQAVHAALDRISIDIPPAPEQQRRSTGVHDGRFDRRETADHDPQTGGGPGAASSPGRGSGGAPPCTGPAGAGGERGEDEGVDHAGCDAPKGAGSSKAGPAPERPEPGPEDRGSGPARGNDGGGGDVDEATSA